MSLKRGWLLFAVAAVLLAFLLFVYDSIARIGERPYLIAKTQAIVHALDRACQAYRLEYGEYPPGQQDFDSRVLHRCLGSTRTIRKDDVRGMTLFCSSQPPMALAARAPRIRPT